MYMVDLFHTILQFHMIEERLAESHFGFPTLQL